MKKILVSIVFALTASIATAQTGSIEPSGMEFTRNGSDIALRMNVAVSAHAVPRQQSIELIPMLSDGMGHSASFPVVLVNGRSRVKVYQRGEKLGYGAGSPSRPAHVVNLWRGSEDLTIAYSVGIPYEEWMRDASLSFVWVLISPAGERHAYSSPDTGMPLAQ
jgi:hypothetical protein